MSTSARLFCCWPLLEAIARVIAFPWVLRLFAVTTRAFCIQSNIVYAFYHKSRSPLVLQNQYFQSISNSLTISIRFLHKDFFLYFWLHKILNQYYLLDIMCKAYLMGHRGPIRTERVKPNYMKHEYLILIAGLYQLVCLVTCATLLRDNSLLMLIWRLSQTLWIEFLDLCISLSNNSTFHCLN